MMLGFHKKSEGVKYIEEKYGVTPQPVKTPTQKLYCIYDVAEAKYKPPFVATTDISARRAISEALNGDKHSLLFKYANEYNLCLLGTYDDDNGLVTGMAQPIIICNLLELKEKDNTVDLPKFVEKEN